ncbi:alpha/beta hydrolase [Amycolatopsis sp. NPDC051372]|uniref:alpha/beta hydrolase n=1 Tax=Amycolatopsis sp. NPDC051372 TaxID=3155669 RepID=UPI0034250721
MEYATAPHRSRTHSYGSTTTGFALGHDTPVDDAMLFGSPGQGSDHLNVPQGHLFNEHDTGDDLVPNIHGTLGPSPYYSPDAMSQYHQMSTDASATELGQLNATSGHSGYLDGKSTSLYNMAAITTGHPDLAQYKGTVIAGAPR